MEQIFNYIYSDTHSTGTSRSCREAYWGLIRLYARAIARTTNGLSGNSLQGVGGIIRAIWPKHASDISLITFNQDLIVEKAIDHLVSSYKEYGDLPWSIGDAYRVNFDHIDPVRQNAQTFTTNLDGSVPVLKLHGSLNWIYEVEVKNYQELLAFLEDPEGEIVCQDDKKLYEELKYTGGHQNIRTIPFIVPPVYDKDPHSHEVLAPVWRNADKLIQETDELIIFGYSFPETDISARTLLRRSFFANDSLNEVTIIDQDPTTAPRIADLLEAGTVHYHQGVRDFKEARE